MNRLVVAIAVVAVAAGCADSEIDSSEARSTTSVTQESTTVRPAPQTTVVTSVAVTTVPLVAVGSTVPLTAPGASMSSGPAGVSAPGVDVIVTGLLGRNPDGTAEVCMWESECLGVRIAGSVSSALDGRWVEAGGSFDGHWLAPTESVREVTMPPSMAGSSREPRCPEIPPGNPPGQDVTEAAQRYTDTVSDLFAGSWIDGNGVLNYFFVGDDIEAHRVAIDEAMRGGPVCVVGGARWSQAELAAVSDQIFDYRFRTDLYLSGGASSVDNVVHVYARLLDDETRQWLSQYGERVRVSSYVELVDAPRADFPAIAPILEGEVPILVQRDGGRNGEQAGVGFTLRYDDERSCVFGEFVGDDGVMSRVVPVWPDGYTATANPLTVYDFDGIAVAVEGQKYLSEGGGGWHDPASLDRWTDQTDTCGVEGSSAMVAITR